MNSNYANKLLLENIEEKIKEKCFNCENSLIISKVNETIFKNLKDKGFNVKTILEKESYPCPDWQGCDKCFGNVHYYFIEKTEITW